MSCTTYLCLPSSRAQFAAHSVHVAKIGRGTGNSGIPSETDKKVDPGGRCAPCTICLGIPSSRDQFEIIRCTYFQPVCVTCHPMRNGATERFWKIFLQKTRCQKLDQMQDRKGHHSILTHGYNAKIDDSPECSPFFLMRLEPPRLTAYVMRKVHGEQVTNNPQRYMK